MHIFRTKYLVALLVLGAAGCAGAPARPANTPAAALRGVEQYAKVELTVDDGPQPATARFVEPDGDVVRVESFEDGAARKVRFTPVELGDYRYTVVDAGGATLARGEFRAVDAGRKGFVHRDPRGGYPGLAFDDGSPFVMLGENRINIYDPSWNYQHKDIGQYVRYMAKHGMTTLRVFVFSDCDNEQAKDGVQPGCLEPEVGHFDQKVARRFDKIFEAAEANGVYVILTPFAIGFSPHDPFKSWQDNPYSKERGGPAKDRFAFFDDAQVRKQAFERIRYIVDRWGYSPNLLAIDLLNEPEWDGEIPEDAWTPWARDLAHRLAKVDPYDHLVTVGSVGLHWNIEGDETRWWSSPADDLVEWHLYGPKVYDVHDLARVMSTKIARTRKYHKPVFIGEFAYGGEDKATYDHTHVGLWSATFSGAGVLAHSAPAFNVDSDELMTPKRAHNFDVLHRLLTPLLGRAPLRADDVVALDRDGARLWTLRGQGAVGLWVMGPRTGYGQDVGDLTVDVDLPAGRWRVEWLDDTTGQLLKTTTVGTFGKPVELAVPTFQRHVAARLWKIS